jgi:hypothetical protein
VRKRSKFANMPRGSQRDWSKVQAGVLEVERRIPDRNLSNSAGFPNSICLDPPEFSAHAVWLL